MVTEENMGNIVQFEDIDEAIAAEIASSFSEKKFSGNGKKFWENRVTQADLPKGTSTFRILPLEGKAVPWISWFEHAIGNKTDVATARKFASFNCPSGGADNGICQACSTFLPRLAVAKHIGGAETMAKEGRAKKKFAMAVVFLNWGGKAVPEEFAGPKVFVYGMGVHKGSDRTQARNILGLAQQHRGELWNPDAGMTLTIKKEGEKMLTSYTVDVIQKDQDVEIPGVGKRKMKMPVMSALPNKEELLENIPDLSPFAREYTAEEIEQILGDLDVLGASSSTGKGTSKFKTKPASTLQDELESGDNIPF
jgi:hypothetical protein